MGCIALKQADKSLVEDWKQMSTEEKKVWEEVRQLRKSDMKKEMKEWKTQVRELRLSQQVAAADDDSGIDDDPPPSSAWSNRR